MRDDVEGWLTCESLEEDVGAVREVDGVPEIQSAV